MTEHEVFICYDNEDKKAADAACQCLEDNDIKCWLKSRDAKIGHEIEDTMESIRQSEAMVLIFSEYFLKLSKSLYWAYEWEIIKLFKSSSN